MSCTFKRLDYGSKPSGTFKRPDYGSKPAGAFKRPDFRLLARWRMFKHNNGSQPLPSFSSPLGGQPVSLVPSKVTDQDGQR